MKRTSTFTVKEIANQNNIKVDSKIKKAVLIEQVTDRLHPACDNEYFNDISDIINIVIAHAHKATLKKNGGIVIKVGRQSVCEIYRCSDSLVHVYVRDTNAVKALERYTKAYHTVNDRWCYPDRFEFTKDSFVDFVLGEHLHVLTDTF